MSVDHQPTIVIGITPKDTIPILYKLAIDINLVEAYMVSGGFMYKPHSQKLEFYVLLNYNKRIFETDTYWRGFIYIIVWILSIYWFFAMDQIFIFLYYLITGRLKYFFNRPIDECYTSWSESELFESSHPYITVFLLIVGLAIIIFDQISPLNYFAEIFLKVANSIWIGVIFMILINFLIGMIFRFTISIIEIIKERQ